MQNRYIDRERYFNELAETSAGYYIDYIKRFKDIDKNSRIMEIGCGEGGNLLPFARMGCFVAGLDLAPGKIDNARKFFAANGADGVFSCADFLKTNPFEGEDKFDVILSHDVIEHIEPEGKDAFFARLRFYLKQDGEEQERGSVLCKVYPRRCFFHLAGVPELCFSGSYSYFYRVQSDQCAQ